MAIFITRSCFAAHQPAMGNNDKERIIEGLRLQDRSLTELRQYLFGRLVQLQTEEAVLRERLKQEEQKQQAQQPPAPPSPSNTTEQDGAGASGGGS